MKCNNCGREEFYANQTLTGTILVLVDKNGNFIGNPTEDGNIDQTDLNFSDPEGPFICTNCDTEIDEKCS
jgi:hypothetical protein